MRWLLVLVAISSTAHAGGGDHFTLYGVGSAIAEQDLGLSTRIEKRLDLFDADDDGETGLFGARIGGEYWNTGGSWGVSMPIGLYAGAQVKTVRTTVGGGVGLWNFTGGGENIGVSPFASTTLELVHGKLVVALDVRLSRQAVTNIDDFNVYSAMFMFGPRYD